MILALLLPLLLVLILAAALLQRPSVPKELKQWPSIGFVYVQLVRSALSKKKFGKKGQAIEIKLTEAVPIDTKKYANYLKVAGFVNIPAQVPINYLFVECFRLAMLAMSHPDFPFPVLGAVLARNTTRCSKPLTLEDKLCYSVVVDPNYVQNDKGDYEIIIRSTATSTQGEVHWASELTLIVINPKRQRGGGANTAAAQGPEIAQQLAQWKLPGDLGRQFGGLIGDRNPIHLYPLTAQLFGFKRPIAHALCLVGKLEGSLANEGRYPSYPATYSTEFKRPTLLPAKLQAVLLKGGSAGTLRVGVLTEDGKKEVIVGDLTAK